MQSTTTPSPGRRGGARPGAGRPPGSMSKLAHEARAKAKETGELPHEFLLRVARGEVIKHNKVDPVSGEITEAFLVPDFPMRVDASKAAAPYFAPKISTVEVIAGVSDEQLDEIIERAAAEAGVSLGLDGEGEEDETPVASGGGPRPRKRVIQGSHPA